jgi:hypothetical protein
MLDQDFVDAYKNGMVVRCGDGVERRLFPRIFTYSADYQEKYTAITQCQDNLLNKIHLSRVLVAPMRDLGTFPCPRCLVCLSDVSNLGTPRDLKTRNNLRKDDDLGHFKVEKARSLIYRNRMPVDGAAVERLLKPTSSVPTLVRLPATRI